MNTTKLAKSFFLTKIFRRIFILFAVSITLLVLFYSYATIQMQKQANLEVLHSRASTLASSIALVCNDAMFKNDMDFIAKYTLNVIKKNSEIVGIIVTNSVHNNLEISRDKWRFFKKLSKDLKGMQRGDEYYLLEYSKKFHKNVFHYSYLVRLEGKRWGYIHIIYSLESYNQSLENIYRSTAVLLGVLFLATLFVSYNISRELTLPILKLTKSAEDVAAGNLHTRVTIERDDEIGELAMNFNSMIDKLEHSHEELENLVSIRTKELEELNRELDIRVKEAIRENSQKEQMLIQQSRLAAMGEMIGNIAHQWRQPLNTLGLIVQNIYYTYEAHELNQEYLEHSMNKSKKLTSLMSKTIDDFRNFFRPDKLQEEFFLSERVRSVSELISASYKNHSITIETELDDALHSVGYPNEFSQVLLNILTNAKDALIEQNVEKPTVWVRSFEENLSIVLEIEDNAGGISEEIIDKIFEPYFTTKDKSVGTGIGLYMSKMIIENNMGGKISVYNGKYGAIFRIEIAKKGSNNV
jgi:signal transduction histidine kinase